MMIYHHVSYIEIYSDFPPHGDFPTNDFHHDIMRRYGCSSKSLTASESPDKRVSRSILEIIIVSRDE